MDSQATPSLSKNTSTNTNKDNQDPQTSSNTYHNPMAAPTTANNVDTAADNNPAGGPSEATKNSLQSTTINEELEETDRVVEDTTNRQQREIELEEEKKLKARHPCIQRPGSEFLQKRLQRGQKYFDSGDYNMAKASPNIKLPDSGTTPVPAINKRP